MSHTVHIDSAVPVPADDVLHALSSYGVTGSIVAGGPGVSLSVAEDESVGLTARIERALEGLITMRRLPLVPERLGGGSFVLRPPAG